MRDPHGAPQLEALVSSLTEVHVPPLCPEIRLHLKPASETFDAFRARLPRNVHSAPPYWSVAWPGGQALARYVLDNKHTVAGACVADIGAGSGLCAIAAMLAGARSACVVDCDPVALAAAQTNALLNQAGIEPICGELATMKLEGAHVVLAGDLWYEPLVARQATSLLRHLARESQAVIAGDPQRSYFPSLRRKLLATYQVPASEEFETATMVTTNVWRLLP